MGKHLKFASVVVDVPSRGTDRPFDYEIPEELADQVEVGCRVHVPFGPALSKGMSSPCAHNLRWPTCAPSGRSLTFCRR